MELSHEARLRPVPPESTPMSPLGYIQLADILDHGVAG